MSQTENPTTAQISGDTAGSSNPTTAQISDDTAGSSNPTTAQISDDAAGSSNPTTAQTSDDTAGSSDPTTAQISDDTAGSSNPTQAQISDDAAGSSNPTTAQISDDTAGSSNPTTAQISDDAAGSSNPTTAQISDDTAGSSNPVPPPPRPPTPNTNRRILHDVCTTAIMSPDQLKLLQLFRVALIASETMKRKDLMVGGAAVGPEGIQVFARGKKPLELDEIKKNVVKQTVGEWVEENLTKEQIKLIDGAGILKNAHQNRKKVAKVSVTSSDGKKIDNIEEGVLSEGPASGNLIKKSTATGAAGIEKENRKGKKRKSDEVENESPGTAARAGEAEIEIDWGKDIEYSWSCNEIRKKIRTFIENGGMKVSAFQRTICTNSNSYGRFMKLRGPWSGIDNSTFPGATRFFKARETAGLPMPKKPKLAASSSRASATTGAVGNPDHSDISGVHLDGEDTDSVPVFDSCDEIRRKISGHLRKPGVTQAQFLRDIAAEFQTQTVRIQGKQLTDFREKSGALSGNTSRVYYGAYVYFEKRRVKEGKEKSKHRVGMEDRWGEGGVDREHPNGGWVIAHRDDVLTRDQWGVLQVHRKHQ